MWHKLLIRRTSLCHCPGEGQSCRRRKKVGQLQGRQLAVFCVGSVVVELCCCAGCGYVLLFRMLKSMTGSWETRQESGGKSWSASSELERSIVSVSKCVQYHQLSLRFSSWIFDQDGYGSKYIKSKNLDLDLDNHFRFAVFFNRLTPYLIKLNSRFSWGLKQQSNLHESVKTKL